VSALVIDRLSHCFGDRQALKDVSLTVEPGSFTVLLGPNGAGKTTLVSLVTGLYAAQHGHIHILGHAMQSEPLKALAKLGVVFQAPTLDLDLTVAENLCYHGSLHDLSSREARARAQAELYSLGILDRVSDKVRTLSGGLRRRVEIARALLHQPLFLIVDEATAGLDVAARRSLISSIRSRCREHALSVLWATHLLDEVEADDPLVVLDRGVVCWSGAAVDLPTKSENLADAFLKLTRGSA
jgi:ABC-2 type transport system ATP-binding protein